MKLQLCLFGYAGIHIPKKQVFSTFHFNSLINIHSTTNNLLLQLVNINDGCWIHVI